MLNRVISDIYHLRRVHSIVPDAVLGDTLKNKLLRLSLQPSLQHLKHEQQQHYAGRHVDPTPVAPSDLPAASSATSQRVPPVQTAHVTSSFASGAGASPPSPYAIDPGALCNLLDSLAYFHLGTSAVAKEAVQLVQLSAPTMTLPQLCTTLAACCALGAQQDITATALPLLNTALRYYSSPETSNTAAPSSSLSSTANGGPALLFSQGANVVLLMDALQKAKVRDREVWHLLAEHCLRYLESFDGRQLCSVVTALCAEGVDDYPDFFVAAERHITAQPSNYLSPDMLQQVVRCYKELHQPVVSLLGVLNAAPQHEESLDRSISAAATVAAMSGTPQSSVVGGGGKHASMTSLGSASSAAAWLERRGGASALSPSAYDAASSRGTASASVQHSLDAFESAAVAALSTADAQGVLELLRKCERRRVMTARVMHTVLARLVTLYYPDVNTAGAEERETASVAGKSSEATSGSEQHSSLELHQLSQCLLIALEFNDATLFVPPADVTKKVASAEMKSDGGAGRGRGFSSPPTASHAAGGKAVHATHTPLITVLLNRIGGELDHWYHPRLLQAVPYAARLLPSPAHPQAFFKSLIAHLRRSSDLSSHERAAPLRALMEALLVLRPYGGEATLVEYMPAMTVAVLNAPRTAQLELTALVAHLPCAMKELVPGIYRQWASQKRWLRTLTETEVESALWVMSRSGQRDSQLLHAVVEYVQAQRDQLPPQRVVEHLHQLARLGVRDLELFTHTAEHLMRRAVESPPSSLSSRAQQTHSSSSSNLNGSKSVSGSARSAGGSETSLASSSAMAQRGQQWQFTTVHDLTLLLYTFTYVLRDSIRVTQQIIARLKMCGSAAAPRDVSLALYSFVKLRVLRNDEVTGQLCERAAATLADFTAAELASVWSSLRCLHHPHAKLHQRTLELLELPTRHEGESADGAEENLLDLHSGAATVRSTWRFSDADCLSLGSALLLTETAPLNPQHPLVMKRDASHPRGGSGDGTGDSNSSSVQPALTPHSSPSAVSQIKEALPPYFERHYIGVCRRLLPSATGQRLYLILCSLSRCRETTLHFSLNTWETLLTLVDTHADTLTTGALGDAAGVAQLEVLAALRVLHGRVVDVDALQAADTVRKESSGWATPYCPPGLWAVLRPRWRDLTRSAAVQAQPSLLAVVKDVKGSGGEAAAAAAVAAASTETKKARSPARKTLTRRSRTL